VIAVAASAQVVFDILLWRLQRNIQAARTRTFVSAGLELRRPDEKKPRQAFLRLENASGVGVWVQHIILVVTAKGRTGDQSTLPLNFAIGPYLSRELEISNFIRDAAVRVDPADKDWESLPHSADVEVVAHYTDEGGKISHKGHALKCRVNFSAQSYESITRTPP
jgi:hypothetical protein